MSRALVWLGCLLFGVAINGLLVLAVVLAVT